MIVRESVKGLFGLVINTDLPVTWHFADNLCGFCTGVKSVQTTDLWLSRYFSEMSIDPKAEPHTDCDAMGRLVMTYPNPFTRHIAYAKTRSYDVPCAVWANNRYGCNGLSDYLLNDYADLHNKSTLNGKLLGPTALQAYSRPAIMSVCLFLRKRPLHDLLHGIICARAEKFCAVYPNRVGRRHKILEVRYIEMDVWNFWQDWANETPPSSVKENCPVCGYCTCACGHTHVPPTGRLSIPVSGSVKVQKVKVEVEEIGNTL